MHGAQLPAGKKSVAIAIVNVETREAYNGFNAGEMKKIPMLLVITSEGLNYFGALAEGALTESKARLPGGVLLKSATLNSSSNSQRGTYDQRARKGHI